MTKYLCDKERAVLESVIHDMSSLSPGGSLNNNVLVAGYLICTLLAQIVEQLGKIASGLEKDHGGGMGIDPDRNSEGVAGAQAPATSSFRNRSGRY